MIISVKYEDACSKFPKQLNELVAKLRCGTSMHKDAAPQCMALYLFFSMSVIPSVQNNIRTFEKLIRATSPAVLRGEIGHWRARSDTTITIPKEMLEEFYRFW